MSCQLEAAGDAMHMRIDDYTFSFSEPGAEDNVCSLTRGAGNGEEFVHFVRNVAAEVIDYFLRSANQRLRFVPEESSRADLRLKRFRLQRCEIIWRWIFLEESGCDHVDADICTLSRENRGD